MKGYDYDGVITKGMLPGPDDCIITGRSWVDVNRTMADMARRGISNIPVYFMPPPWKEKRGREGLNATGEWKAIMIDLTGVEEFFEDNDVQYQAILDNLKGKAKITKV